MRCCGGLLLPLFSAHTPPACTGALVTLMDQYGAAEDGDLALLQELVSAANVDERDADGWTVLHYACKGGHAHVVEWLLGLGADVNARNNYGSTPL